MCMSLITEIPNIQPDAQELYAEYLQILDSEGCDINDVADTDIQKVVRIMDDGEYVPWLDPAVCPRTIRLIEHLKSTKINISQVNYRCVYPSRNYTEHVDQGRFGPITLHVPIKTNTSCYFCYPKTPWTEQQMYHLQEGKVYMCAVNKSHTFMNAGLEERVHLHLHGDDTNRNHNAY